MNPLVSVVIPVYNGEAYVAEATSSVLRQDYPGPVELIIVDDGSTDSTAVVLEKHLVLCREHMWYIRQEKQGAACALNTGVRASQGTYVCWLSHDDVFLQGKLRAQVAAMEADPELWATYTDYETIDASGRVTGVHRVAPHPDAEMLLRLMLANNVNGSSVMLRRSVFDRVGYFDESLTVDVDGDYWFRLLAAGGVMRHVPGRYLQYRRHPEQLSARRVLMEETKDAVRARILAQVEPAVVFGPDQDYVAAFVRLGAILHDMGLARAAEAARERADALRLAIQVATS